MKNGILIAGTIAASVLASVVAVRLTSPNRLEASDLPAEAVQVDEIARGLAELRAEHARLAESLRTDHMEPVQNAMPVEARVPVPDVRAAIEDWVAENPDALRELLAGAPGRAGGGDVIPPGTSATSAVAQASMDEIMGILTDGSVWDEDELWQELRDAGRIDEVLAEFERLAEQNPTNPDLQVALGGAYIQKLFGVDTPAAGPLAMKADAAYDRALELDPEHWEARFSKAVSLSNWPAFLGKAGAAIEHFEILREQQSRMEPHEGFAETYLFLGNMYQQTGDMKKALEVWREGLGLYPDSRELRSQVDVNERRER